MQVNAVQDSLHILEKVSQFYKTIKGKINPKALGHHRSSIEL